MVEAKLILTLFHILGTVLGVGGATMAEIFFLKAIRDGVIDPIETSFLRTTYSVIRIGLFIIIFSGIGYLLLYRLTGVDWYLLSDKYWAKMSITLIILLNAVLIQMRSIPMWLGGAISLTSWYFAMFLGIWRGLDMTFSEILGVYVAAVLIVAYVLHLIKKIMCERYKKCKI